MKTIFLLSKQIENTCGDKHGWLISIGLCVTLVCILSHEICNQSTHFGMVFDAK